MNKPPDNASEGFPLIFSLSVPKIREPLLEFFAFFRYGFFECLCFFFPQLRARIPCYLAFDLTGMLNLSRVYFTASAPSARTFSTTVTEI